MKKIVAVLTLLAALPVLGQNKDTLLSTQATSKVIIHKDDRLDILAEKEAEINTLIAKLNARFGLGYRLQVLSTNDRDLAMKIKSQLLQKFPEQKTYMFFQLPYVKIRFGNFKTQQEGAFYKKQISRMLGDVPIYYVAERIEVKPDKDTTEEEQ